MAEQVWRDGARAWAALAAALALGAVIAWPLDRALLDWQPTRALMQPWRAWTAVFVHYSALHLGANALGALMVGALGAAARVPWRCVSAWLLAWPLTQLGLLAQPALEHYGGLSGVLHAGVAVVALHLLFTASGGRRLIGLALALGLVLKLVADAPWEGVLRHPAGWDIAVAPMAHVTGAAAGALCMTLAEALQRLRPTMAR